MVRGLAALNFFQESESGGEVITRHTVMRNVWCYSMAATALEQFHTVVSVQRGGAGGCMS